MAKPGALGLLRSCLFFSGRKRNKATLPVTIQGEDTTGGDVVSVSVSASLPEDIIFDVLSRLPVRTLCRLRCVSKAWRTLISDPAFAAAQGSRAAAAAPVVAAVFGKPCPIDKVHPPRARPMELRVIDTADRAVLRVVKDTRSAKLMRARLGLVLVDQGEHGARVIDPAAGRVVLALSGQLPAEYPAPSYDVDGASTSSVALHYTGSCHYSFGRAAPSGAYKVLRLGDALQPNDGDGSVIQICQVATVVCDDDSGPVWRQRTEPPILTCHCYGCVAVVDGVLHFMDRGRGSGHGIGATIPAHRRRPGSPGWNRIASFDLESEEWKAVIDGPPTTDQCPEEESWEMVLAELKGTLSVLQTITSLWGLCHSDSYTYIWLLVDPDKSVWAKGYTIRRPSSWWYSKVLDILADGRILMLNSFNKDDRGLYHTPGILQFYNPSTGALTNLLEMGEDFRGPITLYTRSLLF